MTKRQLAVSLVKASIENGVMGNGLEEYDSFADYLINEYEGYGQEFKESEVYYCLKQHANEHPELGQWYSDDCEIFEDDGTIISYRSWSHDIRKLFKDSKKEAF